MSRRVQWVAQQPKSTIDQNGRWLCMSYFWEAKVLDVGCELVDPNSGKMLKLEVGFKLGGNGRARSRLVFNELLRSCWNPRYCTGSRVDSRLVKPDNVLHTITVPSFIFYKLWPEDCVQVQLAKMNADNNEFLDEWEEWDEDVILAHFDALNKPSIPCLTWSQIPLPSDVQDASEAHSSTPIEGTRPSHELPSKSSYSTIPGVPTNSSHGNGDNGDPEQYPDTGVNIVFENDGNSIKRCFCGWPKGSKNKPKTSVTVSRSQREQEVKRAVGRPCGTGPIQRSKAKADAEAREQASTSLNAIPQSNFAVVGLHVPAFPSISALHSQAQSVQPTTIDVPMSFQPEKDSLPLTTFSMSSLCSISAWCEHHRDFPLTDDISATVFSDDEDSDSENDISLSLGHGLGDEDVGDEDDIQNNDPQLDPVSPSTCRPHPLPVWLQKEIDFKIEESGPATFFRLQTSSSNIKPQDLYSYSIMLWDPMPLLSDGIGCPLCNTKLFLHDSLARQRGITDLGACVFPSFLPFNDKSRNGFNGFIPSAQWLRDIYDHFMEVHWPDINQHTAMLSACICVIDHSFKLMKHVAKLNGVQVFVALLTVTNEYGEIWLEVFYTDNMADKEFLENCFPSLHLDVVPVEKYSHLDPLHMPSHISISVLDGVTMIDDAMSSILQLLSEKDDDSFLVIGLDSEWNVEVSHHGYVMGRGQTAVLQLAVNNHIYLLQIGKMLAGNSLPSVLHQEACNSATPFVGAVDLARLAKERHIIKAETASLEDLSAIVLSKCLNKNVSECTSTAWENDVLTEQQTMYAALDAYASLLIYDALMDIPVPAPLPSDPSIDTPVMLFADNTNNKLIAYGTISPHSTKSTFDGINLTKTRIILDINKVLIPGAIVTTHWNRPVQSFGPPVFSVPLTPSVANAQPACHPVTTIASESSGCSSDDDQSEMGVPSIGALMLDNVSGSGSDLPHPGSQSSSSTSRISPEAIAQYEKDKASAETAENLFDGINPNPPLLFDDIMLQFGPRWVWKRCKHIIPPPNILYPLIEAVFQTYGPLKDSKTGLPLFNSAAWAVAKNILELVHKGYLSDPPGVQLYVIHQFDKKHRNLPIYQCHRGMNWTEGMSIRHVQSSLDDFILIHNLEVGTVNKTEKRYSGHYSIWLTNQIQEMLSLLEDILPMSSNATTLEGWLHYFLASMQGTRKAALLVHNDTERVLFRTMMTEHLAFCGTSGPDWDLAIKVWNEVAEREQNVSYKVYYNSDWKTLSNIKQTKAMTSKDRRPVKRLVNDPKRSLNAPNAGQADHWSNKTIDKRLLELPHLDDNVPEDSPWMPIQSAHHPTSSTLTGSS
ncbi:hypothetical protein ARMGADRAFT_1032577 [Armillaria gallica]|uniref:3'-5' exonuclease n=1 Tax=Armillaria gallica TaxID=47427 RepID=A0A2H3DND0_ARMGA|nr:hypothetical protein ARMGADRAFT_1032577 [Armillaria gallica]